MKYEFTTEELKSWFTNEQIEKFGNELLVRRICEIKQINFHKCLDIRIENCGLYSPKLIFDYVGN